MRPWPPSSAGGEKESRSAPGSSIVSAKLPSAAVALEGGSPTTAEAAPGQPLTLQSAAAAPFTSSTPASSQGWKSRRSRSWTVVSPSTIVQLKGMTVGVFATE